MTQTSAAVSEESVAILLHQDDHLRHLGEVASVTTRHVRVVQRKFVSKAGWEIVDIPLADCIAVTYKDERPLFKIFLGVLLTVLTIFIFYMIYVYWDRLDPGTKIPIGALGFATVYGLSWAFRSRRHRLVFSFKDGRTLKWKSASGDYKYKVASARKVVEFARSAGLLAAGSSNPSMQPTAGSGG
jgi:hypothetical protein